MNDEERMKQLLRQAVGPIEPTAETSHDMWPTVLRRIDERGESGRAARSRWVWVDGALLAGLVVLGVSFPATVPLLLYYL